MNKIKILLISLLMIFPLIRVNADQCVDASGNGQRGSVTLNTNSLSISKGKTSTFKVTGSCAAGRLTITSSNTSVATVDQADVFIDDSAVTITVTAVNSGNATISIALTDMGDYAGNVISGTKTVNVTVPSSGTTVVIPSNPTSTTTKNQTNPSSTTTTTTTTTTTQVVEPVVVVKEMKVNTFDIVGYNINFDVNVTDYTIEVSPNVEELYIIVNGDDINVTGDKEVDIKDKNEIVVTLQNETDTKDYTIHINRTASTETTPIPTKPTETKSNNLFLYTTVGLAIVCLILTIVLLKAKSPKEDNVVSTTNVAMPGIDVTSTTSAQVQPQEQTPVATAQVTPDLTPPDNNVTYAQSVSPVTDTVVATTPVTPEVQSAQTVIPQPPVNNTVVDNTNNIIQ